MKKPAANHHKRHKSPKWRTGDGLPGAGVQLPEFRCRAGSGGAGHGGVTPEKVRSRCRVPAMRSKSLNWTLRRYVRASSLRVWLRRHASESGGAAVPADRNGALRVAVQRTATAGDVRLSARGDRRTACRCPGITCCGTVSIENRQIGHLAQVAESVRGGVRRGAAITPRECTGVPDLVLTTLSDAMNVQSNIFGFVMT
jgi:hypothetical protein